MKRAYGLAKILGSSSMQAQALITAARCSMGLGQYQLAISQCQKATELLALSELWGSNQHHHLLFIQAEVHKLKSEYSEARDICDKLIHSASSDRDPYPHALAKSTMAEIDIILGLPRVGIEKNFEAVKSTLQRVGGQGEMRYCDLLQADLNARERDAAHQLLIYRECLNEWSGVEGAVDLESACFQRLARICRATRTNWPDIFIAHSCKFKMNLEVHMALQFMGNNFLLQNDLDTAENLFITALDGFTSMDVHRSRAECMLELGRIARQRGNLGKAKALWIAAKPLFERSSQINQVQELDEQLEELGQVEIEQNSRDTLGAVPTSPL